MEKILDITNHEVVGRKGVLIKLEEFQNKESINAAGVYVPLFENYETDGGRPASKIKDENFSYIGEVIQISEKAKDILAEEKIDIKVGDRVSIHRNQKVQFNHFFPENNAPVMDFSGYILIDPSGIQSKIKN